MVMQLLNKQKSNEQTVFVEPKPKKSLSERLEEKCEKYFDGFKPKTMKLVLAIGLSITVIALVWLATHPVPLV